MLDCVELRSRCDIAYENYIKTAKVEAETMLEMAHRQIIPAALKYQERILNIIEKQKGLGIEPVPEHRVLINLNQICAALLDTSEELETLICGAPKGDPECTARYWHDAVLPLMEKLRVTADSLERLTDGSLWPFPTYGELFKA